MGPTHTEDGKGDTRLLTSRERANLLNTRETSDSKLTQMVPVILLDLARELVLHELDGRHGRVELIDMMLGKVGDTAARVVIGVSSKWLQRTGQELDQGRFTRSVGPDDGDTLVELHVDIDILEDDLVARVPECRLVQLQEWRRQLFGFGEAE